MSAVFGIYLGCTSSCVAVCRDGQSQVIANDLGDRVTPACVGFLGSDVSVGLAAKQSSQRNIANTIFNVKSILGKDFNENADELESYISKSSVKVIRNNSHPVFQVTKSDKVTLFPPIEIASLIFKSLLETAKSHSGPQKSYEAVLTVPVYFNCIQRETIKKAAESVGFKVLRVISECTSPLLAYNIGQNDINLSSNVLVLRIGGQSTDISLVKVINGMYRVVAHHHENDLGGVAIDNALIEFLIGEFKKQSRLDCSKNERSRAKLRLALETCKHALSSLPSSNCSVESLFEGVDFSCNISRSRLDILCTPFVQSCIGAVTKLITDIARSNMENIDKVLLSGGVTKMPQLQQKLQELLPRSEFCTSITPDEVIAVGAAYQAAILSGRDDHESDLFSKASELPCLKTDILLEVADGKREVLFAKKTPIPFRKELNFKLNSGQESVVLHVMQGGNDSNPASSLFKVITGSIIADDMLNVIFHFKHDGSLHVVCSDSSGKHLANINIEATTKSFSPSKASRTSINDLAPYTLAAQSNS